MAATASGGAALHGKDLGEEAGEHSKSDEPNPDTQQDPSTPPSHGGRSRLEQVDGALLSSAHDQREPENQDDDHQCSHGERDERGGGASGH